jgi:hypothetical protein
MVSQQVPEETLVPPNFITTQPEAAIFGGAPKVALASNPASFVILSPSHAVHRDKKNPPGNPRGLVDSVRTLSLAGTAAIGARAPLARHLFYEFLRVRKGNASALYAGVGNIHRQSTANLVPKVK